MTADNSPSLQDPDALDFLDLDSLLSEEEKLLVKTTREFCQEHITPAVADWYEKGYFPREIATEMGRLGLLGMHLSGYGCAGTSNYSYGLACREIEAGDSGARSFMSVQGSLVMFPIWKYGTEEQKQEWLPALAKGEAIGCFGLTEADAGSDPASMRTRARMDGTDWVINGSKMWITNGSIADVALIWAHTDNGVRGFLVPTDSRGFSAHPIGRKLSMRASVTSELVLDEVRVPQEFMLAGVGSMRGPLSCLTEARFGIVWGVVGAARTCYAAALKYAREREQFGKPIGSFQLTQQKLVEMMVKVNRAGLIAHHLGRKKDDGTLTSSQVSFGKMDNVANALEVSRTARSVLGANGITLEYPAMRHMTNLETVYTYEGTNEIHTLILGNAVTGMSAFS